MEVDPVVYDHEELPYYTIGQMVKVGNEWKFLHEGEKYSKDWQDTGEVQAITP